MTRTAKARLVIGTLAVGAIAFLALRPEGDEESGPASQTAPAQPENSQSQAPASEPALTRVRIRNGEVVGGAPAIEAAEGDTVRIVISADAADELHLHGYDITQEAAPGRPARFRFEAHFEGVFEIESHTAEDAGKDPLVARLVVGPS